MQNAGISNRQGIEICDMQLQISPAIRPPELKLNRACELLENTALNISEIAKRIGYDDQRYFARIFKTKKGVTPSAYRLL